MGWTGANGCNRYRCSTDQRAGAFAGSAQRRLRIVPRQRLDQGFQQAAPLLADIASFISCALHESLTIDFVKFSPIARRKSTPSEADIKVTRDLIRAGQLLKIKLDRKSVV